MKAAVFDIKVGKTDKTARRNMIGEAANSRIQIFHMMERHQRHNRVVHAGDGLLGQIDGLHRARG